MELSNQPKSVTQFPLKTKNNHLMKFLDHSNPKLKSAGIKCYPQQLFGVSRQSPEHFKSSNTLVADYGYMYDGDTQKKTQFEYYSQEHYITLATLDANKKSRQFEKEYSKTINSNKLGFHRRKGRLSEFMDKNGWMESTCKLMGDERDKNARQLSNRDRQNRISTKRQFLSTQRKSMKSTWSKTTVNPEQSDMIKMIMSEKMKIRKMRNELANMQKGEKRPVTSLLQKGQSMNLKNLYGHKKQQERQLKSAELGRNDLEGWKNRTCMVKFYNPQKTFHGTKYQKKSSQLC